MQHISRSTTIQVKAPVDEALPLFTAVGECLWVPGWNPTYIYPESGEAETGMIWKTDTDGKDAIWVTVNYDTVQHLASYVKWTPEKHVTRIDIDCNSTEDGNTQAQVTYTLTALAEEGHADIEKLTEKYYQEWIASWEVAINHYLDLGEILPTH